MRKCNTGLQFCQENSLWINDTLFNSSFQITYCQQPKDVQLSIFLSELLKTQKGLIPQHIPIIGRSFPVQVKGRYKQDGRGDLAPTIRCQNLGLCRLLSLMYMSSFCGMTTYRNTGAERHKLESLCYKDSLILNQRLMRFRCLLLHKRYQHYDTI